MKDGINAYNDRFKKLAENRIAKTDPKYCLSGFYNFLIANKSFSSAYLYLGYVIGFLKDIDDISKIDIDNYNGYLASLKTKSSNVQIDAYHALQKYSKYLKAKGICKDDYMEYVERPKFVETQEAKEKREKGFLNKTEAKKLISRCADRNGFIREKADCWKKRDEVIIKIFLNTGIRCSALYKMDIDNVNLNERTISVLEKGNKYRKISISPEIADAISDWLDYRSEILDGKDEKAFIISERKKRLEAQSIRYIVKRIGDVVPDKNISPHKLRSTYGTQLYNQTRDVYFVQQCMGHSSPKTTEIYIRGQQDDALQKAADLMANFLG